MFIIETELISIGMPKLVQSGKSGIVIDATPCGNIADRWMPLNRLRHATPKIHNSDGLFLPQEIAGLERSEDFVWSRYENRCGVFYTFGQGIRDQRMIAKSYTRFVAGERIVTDDAQSSAGQCTAKVNTCRLLDHIG